MCTLGFLCLDLSQTRATGVRNRGLEYCEAMVNPWPFLLCIHYEEGVKLMDETGMKNRISLIDYQIMNLFKERMEVGARLKKLTGSVPDKLHEEDHISYLVGCTKGIMRPQFTETLFRGAADENRFIEEQDLQLIGFQGEHGAFSEEASYAYNPSLMPVPYKEFGEIFQEVVSGAIDFAIVPIENSFGGTVTPVMDLLIESDVYIVGEITMPIHHCLLVLPDMDYRDLKMVYSHSRAIAQCRNFIQRHKIDPRPYYDTAGSAKMLSENRPESAGAIASRLCAELYHLDILNENIEDYHSNSTRFSIISKRPSPEEGSKGSIVFAVQDETGSLLETLKAFSDAGINIARIDSRPMKETPDRYVFSLDFAGSDKDERVRAVLKTIEEKSVMYKFLGCYNKRH